MPPAVRAALKARGPHGHLFTPHPRNVIACTTRDVLTTLWKTVTAHFPHVETEALEGRATCCRSHSCWLTKRGEGGGAASLSPACSLHCPFLNYPLHANPHHRVCLGGPEPLTNPKICCAVVPSIPLVWLYKVQAPFSCLWVCWSVGIF